MEKMHSNEDTYVTESSQGNGRQQTTHREEKKHRSTSKASLNRPNTVAGKFKVNKVLKWEADRIVVLAQRDAGTASDQ